MTDDQEGGRVAPAQLVLLVVLVVSRRWVAVLAVVVDAVAPPSASSPLPLNGHILAVVLRVLQRSNSEWEAQQAEFETSRAHERPFQPVQVRLRLDDQLAHLC
jgi:hypothetical protein